MAAANALRYLKTGDANTYTPDSYVWYTLAERIHRKRGVYTGWMIHHTVPLCPIGGCHSECKFRRGVWFNEAVCARYPSEHGRVDNEIRETVVSLYNRSFAESESISELTFR